MRRPRKHLSDGTTINPLWQPVKIAKRKKKPLPPVDRRAEYLMRDPFPCANCDSPVADARLFCPDLCRQEAKSVRYIRACIAYGRVWEPDVAEAIQIRRAHINSGGYDERSRQLSKSVRQAVIDRDGGLCRKCGAPGTEVDHIIGDSGELTNLQLLCPPCHRQKTMLNVHPMSREEHPEEWAIAKALDGRIFLRGTDSALRSS
jgi:5-methylcytosine-specific restriction endonuclease McrA